MRSSGAQDLAVRLAGKCKRRITPPLPRPDLPFFGAALDRGGGAIQDLAVRLAGKRKRRIAPPLPLPDLPAARAHRSLPLLLGSGPGFAIRQMCEGTHSPLHIRTSGKSSNTSRVLNTLNTMLLLASTLGFEFRIWGLG